MAVLNARVVGGQAPPGEFFEFLTLFGNVTFGAPKLIEAVSRGTCRLVQNVQGPRAHNIREKTRVLV